MPAFRYIILLPFICLSLLNTHSALSQVFFNKILPPPGKTLEHVTGITQDANGYMWFATISGLYSFDGYHFTSYVNNLLNPNSLASSRLESIYADHDGIIWVGTFGAGLDRFDPATGIFTHFRHEPNNLSSLSNDSVARELTAVCPQAVSVTRSSYRPASAYPSPEMDRSVVKDPMK